MGYMNPFETQNAIYVVSLENHHQPDYEGLDKGNDDVGARVNF